MLDDRSIFSSSWLPSLRFELRTPGRLHHPPTTHLPSHSPLTHSLTHSPLAHPPTHPPTYPLTHSPTHSITTHSLTHSLTRVPLQTPYIVPSVELKHLPLGSQEIITLLVVPALSQVNLIYTSPSSFKTHFYMIVSFLIRSFKLSLSFTFCHQNPLCIFLLLHMCHMPCPSHHP